MYSSLSMAPSPFRSTRIQKARSSLRTLGSNRTASRNSRAELFSGSRLTNEERVAFLSIARGREFRRLPPRHKRGAPRLLYGSERRSLLKYAPSVEKIHP